MKKPITTISKKSNGLIIRDADQHGAHGKYGETAVEEYDDDLIEGFDDTQ
jgi:hypothetical protein